MITYCIKNAHFPRHKHECHHTHTYIMATDTRLKRSSSQRINYPSVFVLYKSSLHWGEIVIHLVSESSISHISLSVIKWLFTATSMYRALGWGIARRRCLNDPIITSHVVPSFGEQPIWNRMACHFWCFVCIKKWIHVISVPRCGVQTTRGPTILRCSSHDFMATFLHRINRPTNLILEGRHNKHKSWNTIRCQLAFKHHFS